VLVEARELEDNASVESLACQMNEDDEPGSPQGSGKRIVKITGVAQAELEALDDFDSGNTLMSTEDAELTDDELKVKPGKFKLEKKSKNIGNNDTDPGFQRGRRDLAVLGIKKTLVVRVTAADAATTAPASTLSDKVFGTTGDEVNLKTWYDECSHGRVNFVPATSVDNPDIVNGVTEISIAINVNGVSDGTVREAVRTALDAQLQGDWESKYDHTMMCLPPGTSGGWIGYAYIGHYLSVFNDNWCTYPSIQMHEIGHNLGMGHSGEGSRASSPYADQSGMMGYSYSSDSIKMCFNGAKMWYLGWFVDFAEEVDPTVTPLWSGDLVGVATFSEQLNENVVVKIETAPDGPQCRDCYDFYVAFNRAAGINSNTQEGQNQVLITEQGDGQSNAQSLLVAKLNEGMSYTIVDFGAVSGESVTVTVNSINLTTGLANISINHSSGCQSDADCGDNMMCNGVEICDTATGQCQTGTPMACDDGMWCNGEETCDDSIGCVDATTPVCTGGDSCTGFYECSEADGACVILDVPESCDDGNACNGLETCNTADGSCNAGEPILRGDDDICNGVETCDPTTGQCLLREPALVCVDEFFCNGVETCDPTNGCQYGTPPDCEAESNFCTGTVTCSDEEGACVSSSEPALCDDGNACNGLETCDPDAKSCIAGEAPICSDGKKCNGEETCDDSLGCVAGVPLQCDNGIFCDGTEQCDDDAGCVAGAPPICDNGLFCDGEETCDENEKSCKSGSPPDCDDGQYCNGAETCQEGEPGGYFCAAGIAVTCLGSTECNPLICDSQTKSCVADTPNTPETCCGDGVCNDDEECASCSIDCISGTILGTRCGNGICEDGENCNNCSSDCASRTNGPGPYRYCCAGGPSGDCSAGGCSNCDTTAATDDIEFCCGDGVCNEDGVLGESNENCAIDCTNSSTCGDGTCNADESFITCPSDCTSCGNGVCDNGENTTTCPTDCPPLCRGKNEGCVSGIQCCSNWCKTNGRCG
jgi:hypothetical protein